MSVATSFSATLPQLQPDNAGARLLLFGVRQIGVNGLNDACVAHAFVTAFGKEFQRPLVLLRVFMQELSAVSAGPTTRTARSTARSATRHPRCPPRARRSRGTSTRSGGP